MLVISYTKSEELALKISKLESLRRDICAAAIGKSTLYRMQWEATISRIEASIIREGGHISRANIYKILNSGEPQPDKIQNIIRYKSALDYIRTDWYVSEDKISPHAIAVLDEYLTGNKKGSLSTRTPVQGLFNMKQLLSYLQSGNEHPIIQAGIVYVELIHKEIIPQNSDNLATLLAYMFLYSYGWDFRELLVLEKAWIDTSIDYNHALSITLESNNATAWLNYFIETVSNHIQNILNSLSVPTMIVKDISQDARLNSRHLKIIAQLDNPQMRITNKDIQNRYNISQITASRDLATLSLMGILRSHGKGRSTYYTRA